jgi:hypothetical protein
MRSTSILDIIKHDYKCFKLNTQGLNVDFDRGKEFWAWNFGILQG